MFNKGPVSFAEEFLRSIDTCPLEADNSLYLTSLKFDTQFYNDRLFQLFNLAPNQEFESSVQKRKAEFLSGRLAAKLASEKLGFVQTQVTQGNNREPIFPPGLRGSISHTDSTAHAIVGHANRYAFLGIDAEAKLPTDQINQIASLIISRDEEDLIKQFDDYNTMFTLVFSAKECFFKALYPYAKQYFDFLDAKIDTICMRSKSIIISLKRSLNVQLPQGLKQTINFKCDQSPYLCWLACPANIDKV